jgi:hypothetical protein
MVQQALLIAGVILITVGILRVYDWLLTGSRDRTMWTQTMACSQSHYGKQEDHTANGAKRGTILDRCYRGRFHGYWDFDLSRMRFFDRVCDESLVALVKMPQSVDASSAKAEFMQGHTDLYARAHRPCILMLGDSTDRQILSSGAHDGSLKETGLRYGCPKMERSA